jgi:hypothetical protein
MSPLVIGEEVNVIGAAPPEDCRSEIFVFVTWHNKEIAVPLDQLEPVSGDEDAVQLIEDWLYWRLMGYEF